MEARAQRFPSTESFRCVGAVRTWNFRSSFLSFEFAHPPRLVHEHPSFMIEGHFVQCFSTTLLEQSLVTFHPPAIFLLLLCTLRVVWHYPSESQAGTLEDWYHDITARQYHTWELPIWSLT